MQFHVLTEFRFFLKLARLAMFFMLWVFQSALALANPGYHIPGVEFSATNNKIKQYIASHPDIDFSLALVRGDSVEFIHNYPSGDGANKIYRAGSLAKVVTALAIMQLQDRSLIDIDQPVYAYLPRFSIKRRFSNANPITVRHLLTHHSGLPTDIAKGQWSYVHFSSVIEQLRNGYLSYPPDFVRAYSNIGYTLLGALIEEVAGQSYESFVKENIFDPLGMKDSGFDKNTTYQKNFVQPYKLHTNERLLPIRDVPAMGMYTTAEDMAKFIIMLSNKGKFNNKVVVHASVLEEMMERNNQHVTLDYDHEDGIGLQLNHCILGYPGDVIEHGGYTMHYSGHFVAVPDYGIGAVVLSNSRAAKKFVHTLAAGLVKNALRKYNPDDEKQSDRPPGVSIVNQNNENGKPASIGKRGKYLTKSGLLTMQVDGSDMCACVGEKRLDLVAMPDGWYGVKNKKKSNDAKSIELSPQKVDGKIVLAMRKGERKQRLGEYIPEEGIPPRWRSRLGDYKLENPDPEFPLEDIRLMEEDNLMYLSYHMPLLSEKRIDIPLTALDGEQAITTGLGRGRGETLQVEKTDEGEYLLFSGYLVKKVTP